MIIIIMIMIMLLIKRKSLYTLILAANFVFQISKSFSTSHFEQWIKQHLTINPQGPQNLLKKKGEVRTLCYRSETVGKILTSSADE